MQMASLAPPAGKGSHTALRGALDLQTCPVARAAAVAHPVQQYRIRHCRAWEWRHRGLDSCLCSARYSRGHKRQVSLYAVEPANAAVTKVHKLSAAQQTIERFYSALNSRDMSVAASCLAQDVRYENLGVEGVLSGRSAVSQFCVESMLSVPDDAVLVAEQQTEGSNSSIAVVWRLLLNNSQTVLSRGIAFYTFNQQGLMTGVTECHEHPVKISQSSLTLMRPLVKSLAAPLLPAVQQVSRTLQQGAVNVISPLTAVAGIAQPTAAAAAPSPQPGYYSTPAQWPSGAQGTATTGTGYSSSAVQQHSSARPAGSSTESSNSTRQIEAFGASLRGATAARSRAQQTQSQLQVPSRASAASAAARDPHTQTTQDFSGLWAKDAAQSDAKGYEVLLDVLGLSGLQKVTARLIDGLDIKQSSNEFIVSFVTVVPFFKVTERVPLNAGSTLQNRRDLRPGKQTAAARTVDGGGVLVDMTWGQPLAGRLTELYMLLDDGSLCVHAEVQVGQQTAAADTVYRRSGGSRSELLSESRRRNGSLNDVMQRQNQQGLDV